METYTIKSGETPLNKRDINTLTLHYGQIDRWVAKNANDKTTLLNTSNREKVEIGEKVFISSALFMSWLTLRTRVDRTDKRKINDHAKGSVEYIASLLGYKGRNGLYKILKPLYEVGLIDMKEFSRGSQTMVDIIVYPYPIISDSNICDLHKFRTWEQRDSKGMMLSRKGVIARKKKREESLHKSEQEPVHKSEQEPVHKSEQEPVHKSEQEPVHKSEQSNIIITSNDLITSNDFNHHLRKVDNISEKARKSLLDFIISKGIFGDDDLIDKLFNIVSEYPPVTNSHVKYYEKVLRSIIENNHQPSTSKKNGKTVRKEKLPEWYANPDNKDSESIDLNDTKIVEQLIDFARKGNQSAINQLDEMGINWVNN
jgi:hypothetical protein